MKIWESALYLAISQKKSLLELHRKAWNGLSILIVRDDSALTPHRHRINYYVLIFFGLMLFSIPAVALGLFVERRVTRSDPAEVFENRLLLLHTMQMIAEEQTALLARTGKQIYRYQDITGDRSHLLEDFINSKYNEISGEKQPITDKISQTLTEIQKTRSRSLVFNEAAYYALNKIWNRMSVHYIMPKGRPLKPGVGVITSVYGYRENPFVVTISVDGEFHGAIDLAAPHGSPIMAAAPGVVIQAVTKVTEGYGRFVRIHHGLGYTTLYAHCQDLVVEPGAVVKRGQLIAHVGRSGRTTGPHLHYEVQLGEGKRIDPMPYMQLK